RFAPRQLPSGIAGVGMATRLCRGSPDLVATMAARAHDPSQFHGSDLRPPTRNDAPATGSHAGEHLNTVIHLERACRTWSRWSFSSGPAFAERSWGATDGRGTRSGPGTRTGSCSPSG